MKKKFKVLVILLIGCFLVVGCGKKNDNIDKHINLNAPNDIKVETFYDSFKEHIIVKLTNESSSNIKALKVEAEYPGEDSNIYSVIIKNLKANNTTYAMLELPFDDDFEYYVPNKFDLNILTDGDDLDSIEDVSQYFDKIQTDYSVNDNIINYSLANNSGKILGSVDSIIVYFKDGKPIAGDYIMALDVDLVFNLERDVVYKGDIDNPEYLDYDNIEIFVTSINDDYEESEDDEEIMDDDFYIEEETVDEDDDMAWE